MYSGSKMTIYPIFFLITNRNNNAYLLYSKVYRIKHGWLSASNESLLTLNNGDLTFAN